MPLPVSPAKGGPAPGTPELAHAATTSSIDHATATLHFPATEAWTPAAFLLEAE